MIRSPIPQSFDIGLLTLYPYGLILGISVLLIIIYVQHRFPNRFKELEIFLVLLASLAGARLVFILHNLDRFSDNITASLKVWDGGLALFGALFGGAVAIYLLTKRKGIRFFELTDTIILILPISQAFGRFGNFINNELYGKPTSMPLALFIPEEKRLNGYENYSTFHPTFLYEMMLSLISFGIIFWIYKKKRFESGILTAIYLINYGIIRLVVNRFRIDKEYLGFIETSDLFSVLFILIGALMILKLTHQFQFIKDCIKNPPWREEG